MGSSNFGTEGKRFALQGRYGRKRCVPVFELAVGCLIINKAIEISVFDGRDKTYIRDFKRA